MRIQDPTIEITLDRYFFPKTSKTMFFCPICKCNHETVAPKHVATYAFHRDAHFTCPKCGTKFKLGKVHIYPE